MGYTIRVKYNPRIQQPEASLHDPCWKILRLHCVVTPFWSGATGGENRFLKVCGCGLTQNFSSGFNHPVVVASCHGRCKKFDSWGRHEHVSLPKNNIAPEKWIVGRLSFWGGKRSIFRGYNGYRLYT